VGGPTPIPKTSLRVPTPAAAAAELFGIRNGVTEPTDAERERLARLCTIALRDSDHAKKRPTISFRDLGIGLSPSEMPNTILSLEENNKLKKPYLHGIFGKGGSAACVFSDATGTLPRPWVPTERCSGCRRSGAAAHPSAK
jgi:hypothetical protein